MTSSRKMESFRFALDGATSCSARECSDAGPTQVVEPYSGQSLSRCRCALLCTVRYSTTPGMEPIQILAEARNLLTFVVCCSLDFVYRLTSVESTPTLVENVAVNRGMNMRVFTDFDEALRWVSQETPDKLETSDGS